MRNQIDEKELLEYISLENKYRETFLGDDNIVKNNVYINDDKIFPKRWYSKFDYDERRDLLTKALEKGKLIKELEEYDNICYVINKSIIEGGMKK